jgi:hypothetical protein
MANLVAMRCDVIDPRDDREGIWYAQWRSWQPGGLRGLANELLAVYPKASFSNCPTYIARGDWPGYIERELEKICLDPDYQPTNDMLALWEAVDGYRTNWIEQRSKGVVQTEIGKQIADALTYAHQARTTVVINGDPGLGKSFAARQFCELSGGLMRYVGLRSTTGFSSFLREICKALGLASNLNLKAQVLDERIQNALASGDLSLCFDEAHYLWPQGRLRCAYPAKLNWIMTTLCNMGVPVAFVTTPQWYTAQAELERQTAWSSAQLKGRIGHVQSLPKELSAADLRKVTASIFPGADDGMITTLVNCSELSAENLRPIDAISKRAAYLAQKGGREIPNKADVQQAIKDNPVSLYLAQEKPTADTPAPAPRVHRGGFAARPRPRSGITTRIFSRSSAPALEEAVT